jgi:3-hydroxyacyl-CoA dehydrogenase
MPPLVKAFEQISTARVAKSAAEARDENFLRRTDRITMNRDRLLADAKARALELVADYQPPAPAMLRLAGATGRAALKLAVNGFVLQGKATPHDIVVCERLADTLTGGEADYITDTSEDAILKLERSAFMALLRHAATLARIEHMLETGKPLRN